jgi:hypothetical protein
MAKKKSGMTDSELISLLDRSISNAETYADGEAAALRRLALKFLNGEVDIPAEAGKSKAVSQDMADTLHWILPSLLRIFLASDHVGIYEPRRQDFVEETIQTPEGEKPVRRDVSEERASQATDYVNYVLLNDCRGYSVLHSALYEALAFGNGLIKHWWDDSLEYETESFSGLSEDAFTALVSDKDVIDVLEHDEYDDPDWIPPEIPSRGELIATAASALQAGVPAEQVEAGAAKLAEMLVPPKLHDCKIKRLVSEGRLRIQGLPHEEFFIGSNDLVIDEEETLVCGHAYRATRSDLLLQGYPRDKIDNLPEASEKTTDETKVQRRGTVDEQEADWATTKVQVYESYIKCDYDGDGVAERRKVVLGGSFGALTMLSNDEWGDDLPFTDLVPDPVPYRWRGRSLLEETADIARMKTVLMRQTMDNLYQTNNPQIEVRENAVKNMDVLVNRKLGGVVVTSGPDAVKPIAVPFVAKESFSMLEYLDMVKETRTGVSRQSTGLDMDALQNQTATAVKAMQSASYAKNETYARNVAENGMRRLFRCLLRLITKHQDRPRMIRLRGEWVEMTPNLWNPEMDVVINTGLGSGSRDRDMQVLQGILAEQKTIIMQAGPLNPICDIRKYRDTLAKMVELAGFRSPERFFGEVTDDDLAKMEQQASKPPAPDPRMMEAQARLQIDKMKADQKAQADQQQFSLDVQKAQVELQTQRERSALEMQLMREEASERLKIMQQEAAQKFELKRQELEYERQLAAIRMMSPVSQQNATNIPAVT